MQDDADVDDVSTVDDFGPTPEDAAAREVIAAVVDAINEIAGAPVLPDPPPAAPQQRLRIHVPVVSTTLTLGAKAPPDRIREEDGGLPNFAGFGVHSAGHAYVDIVETMTLQSMKSAALQSNANVGVGAKEDLVLGAGGGVLVSGGGGVTIAGGWPTTFPESVRSDGEEPQEPKWVAGCSGTVEGIAAAASGFDALVGLSLAGRGLVQARNGQPLSWKSMAKAAAWVGGALDSIGAGVSGLQGVTSKAAWEGGALGFAAAFATGTNIYGQGGVLVLSSLGAVDIYGALGASLNSPLSVGILAGVSAEIMGVLDVEVSAMKGDLGLGAGKELTIAAGDTVKIASTTGKVAVGGSGISIGARAGSEGQAGTATLDLDAGTIQLMSNTLSLLQSDDTATVKGVKQVRVESTTGAAHLGGVGVTVAGGAEVATVSSDKMVGLRSGSMLVSVAPSSVVLGKAPGSLPAAPTPPTHEAPPPKPKGKKKVKAWAIERAAVAERNRTKDTEHKAKVDSWRKDVDAMKETSVGIVIKDSKIDFVVSGHRLTIDGSSVTHPSLKILK